MITYQKLTRAAIRHRNRFDSVKKAEDYFTFIEIDRLCEDLNRLRSHDGDPDPRLSGDDVTVLYWAEYVLAPLCPTQSQKAKERADLTWERRAETALGNYHGYFGNWAQGCLAVELCRPAYGPRTPHLSCSIKPVTNSTHIQGNRGVSGRLLPNSVPATRENEMAVRLWNVVFLQEGYKRLKRCHHCERWFVDKGKNRIARFCSPSCTNRWWNKGRRLDSPNYGNRPNKSKKRRKD